MEETITLLEGLQRFVITTLTCEWEMNKETDCWKKTIRVVETTKAAMNARAVVTEYRSPYISPSDIYML